ncbi:MAG: hypothetical protein WAW17_02290 [Rhodococcus sp. (in: high G+C Gram-positive bacteria)]|uniref:hypothetical protein n=1 Tax=Rhodococcus sp. TaxID=1831 RepID=UPI003BB0CC8C
MPLKPAVQMGADQLGMVATRPRHWLVGLPSQQGPDIDEPDLFNTAAVTLRAMLADRMVEDLHRLEARNAEVGAYRGAAPFRHIDVQFAARPWTGRTPSPSSRTKSSASVSVGCNDCGIHN